MTKLLEQYNKLFRFLVSIQRSFLFPVIPTNVNYKYDLLSLSMPSHNKKTCSLAGNDPSSIYYHKIILGWGNESNSNRNCPNTGLNN